MSNSTEIYEGVSGGVQFLASSLGKIYGGPLGQAYATFLTGQNSWVASTADLVSKVDQGTARPEEYADVAVKTAQTLAAFGVLIGVAPISTVGLTGYMGFALMAWKNKDYLSKKAEQLNIPITGGNDALITKLAVLFNLAEQTVSPLVLDLDGDGVETIASSKTGVHFDLDKSGFAEQTGWVGKDDGLLVRDLNGDGKITSGGELFGNHTQLKKGNTAANGFEALKDLDDNSDGVVDSKDSAFNNLKVWKDIDSNGIVDAGELIALTQAGIKNLKVGYANLGVTAAKDAQGNQHQQLGSYTKTDGSIQKMNDVWFSVDTARTVNLNTVNVSAEVAALPDVAGMGNLKSLRQAKPWHAMQQIS